jgi:hypothetical protein
MNIAIIDKVTLEIKNIYWSESGQLDITRQDVDDTVVQSIIPSEMDYWCIKSTSDFTIVADNDKIFSKEQKKFEEVRVERNRRLSSCDWTQTKDAPMTSEKQNAWAQYRQELRDVPMNTTDPDNPSWPAPPS